MRKLEHYLLRKDLIQNCVDTEIERTKLDIDHNMEIERI